MSLVIALMGGASFDVWGDTTVTYDFSAMGQAGYSLSWGGTIYEVNGLNCYNLNGFKDAESNEVLSFSDYYLLRTREKYKEYVYLDGANGLRGGSKAAPLQIFNLQAGDKVVFTYTCEDGGDLYWHTTNATSGGEAVTANATLTSGAEYVVKGDGEQNIIVYFPASKNTCLKRLAITTTKVYSQVKTYDFKSWAGSGYTLTTSESSIDVKYTPVGASSQAKHNCKYITSVMNGETLVQNINSEIAAYGDVANGSSNNLYLRSGYGLFNGGSGYRAFVMSSLNKDATVTITSGKFCAISANLTTDGENGISSGTELTSNTEYTVLSSGNVNIQLERGKAIEKIIIDNKTAETFSSNPSISYSDGYITITPAVGNYGGFVYTYYTTDGTEPAPGNGTLYTEPIASVGSVNIKAKSYLVTGATSETASYSATILTSPTITRSNNSVTITADAGTVYYKYNSDDYVEYTGAITVAADATVYAYAATDGSENSAIVSRAVALFPTAGVSRTENVSRVNYTSLTRGEESTVSERTYSAIFLDDTQWGNNVYFQNSGWNFRNNNTWYINQSGAAWLLFKNMKAGDIIVINTTKAAVGTVNATYSEKYTQGSYWAYIVDADGDVELGFNRVSSQANNYIYSVSAYTHTVTGTQVGAFDNTTGYMTTTSDKVTLKPGESYHYNFKNYNSGGNGNYNNYLLAAYDGNDVVKAVVRADNFEVVDWKNTGCTNDFNWTNFVSKMNGATVDMTVSYSASNVLDMTATITTNEATPSTWTYSYTSDYNGSGISLSDNIKIALSVDHSWLDIVSEGKTAIAGTIASSGYSSLASAYGLDFANATGLTNAFVVTNITKDAVMLSSVDELPANSGVILKGTGGAAYSIPVKADASFDGTNKLHAAVTAYDCAANEVYILQSGLFHLVTAASTVPAGKAYLLASDVPNEARSLMFAFDDETTGIDAVSSNWLNGDFYNLQGQRVDSPKKGLYIVNGRKVLVK